MIMPDGDRKPFVPISHYAGDRYIPWAYCKDEAICGHNARLDITAMIAQTGDIPSDKFRHRLRCSKCVRSRTPCHLA
jgi:hypothetical protein